MSDLHRTSLATLKIPGLRSFAIVPLGVASLIPLGQAPKGYRSTRPSPLQAHAESVESAELSAGGPEAADQHSTTAGGFQRSDGQVKDFTPLVAGPLY